MTFCEELYFDITVSGPKKEINKFVSFLKSGELDDFFEFSPNFINFDDDYPTISDDTETEIVISNDDLGVEIDEFDSNEFLEVFCIAAKNLYVSGRLFDIDDEEYEFISDVGDSYYLNAKKRSSLFDDELEEDDDYL